MGYRHHLRQVRRARRRAKAQQRALLRLELEGFVAPTLPTATLTVPLEQAVGAQVAGMLHEALRERHRILQTEAGQLRRDGGENDYRRGHAGRESAAPFPVPATVLPGGATDRAPPPAGGRMPQS